MEIIITQVSERRLIEIKQYILAKWGQKVENDFKVLVKEKFEQIKRFPQSHIKHLDNIYKCVISKQTSIFYTINYDEKKIIIITVFDTRQNPDTLESQLNQFPPA